MFRGERTTLEKVVTAQSRQIGFGERRLRERVFGFGEERVHRVGGHRAVSEHGDGHLLQEQRHLFGI